VSPNGPQSGPFIRNSPSRPFTRCEHGAQVHDPATWEGQRAGRLRVVCKRAASAGASCWRGTSWPRGHLDSDLPRKLVSQSTALCAQDSCQEPPNSDLTRKGIVTSHARSKAGYQDTSGDFLVERSDLVRVLPANRNIDNGCCRVRGWLRRGCAQYRLPAQVIVTPHARNSDPSRKVIVTRCARNSDLSRKVIVTACTSNSDLTRKGTAKISCKAAYSLSPEPASLLCVCMFNVPDVYRKGGGGWG
jgi:hypothetical protein